MTRWWWLKARRGCGQSVIAGYYIWGRGTTALASAPVPPHTLPLPPTTTMSTNPSHILIARNSRNSNNPSAALSSPTETHAAASGIFRSGSMCLSNSASSPQWLLEECDADDAASALGSAEGDVGEVELDTTFTRQCRFPGTVKIVVESTTFW